MFDDMSPPAFVIDAHGWRNTDEVLPANLQCVLIWNGEMECVQFAEFKMYSGMRYEFTQGSDTLSIHDVPFWQPEPAPPTAIELGLESETEGDAK